MDLAETPDQSPNADSNGDSGGSSGSWLQILANYATILIAVSAVILSVWEGYEMRQHNRLSVVPHLDGIMEQWPVRQGERVEIGGVQKRLDRQALIMRARIENSGLGPAVFTNGLLYRAGADTALYETKEGEPLEVYDADSLVHQIQNQFANPTIANRGVPQGAMMNADESRLLFAFMIPVNSIPDTLKGSTSNRIRAMIDQYSFVMCYCSVYEQDCDHAAIGAEPPSNACDV